MRIDAHQHFWKYNQNEYSWINNEMDVLKKNFLPEDLEKELKTIDFNGSIAVQARQSLKETEWLLKLADEYNCIKGVVGWVNLCSPEIEEQLNKFSQCKKLVGVRHVVHDEPDDNFMDRDDFKNGISLLSKYNLTYDLLIFPKHLALANKLVSYFPNQKFVLNHIAKPLIKDKVHSPWNEDIKKLAEQPNVYCKLSGMVTEADWKNWKSEQFKYYLDVVFKYFGTDRLMIGSDWPVCNVAGGYRDVMLLVIKYLNQFDFKIKRKILGLNCQKFYLNN